MTYDPFERGPHPAGVTSSTWLDDSRGRELPIEIWYPASDTYRGQDLDPDRQDVFLMDAMAVEPVPVKQAALRDAERLAGSHPLVVFSHGFAGDRREETFLATHLASRGYVVVAANHMGDTFADVMGPLESGHIEVWKFADRGMANRRGDIPFMLDQCERELACDLDRVGITGASLGGWTCLESPSVDRRVRAIVPQCPGGGSTLVLERGRGEPFLSTLSFDWAREVPTLFVVADRDSWVPLYGQLELIDSVPSRDKRMIVLRRSEHVDFGDDIEAMRAWFADFTRELGAKSDLVFDMEALSRTMPLPEELLPAEHAHDAIRGLVTAHMDAHLLDSDCARSFLVDPRGRLAERGVEVFEVGVS